MTTASPPQSEAPANGRVLALHENADPPDIGIHYDIPSDTYHSWNAVDYSYLKQFSNTAEEGHAEFLRGGPDSTAAKDTGTAFHAAVLDPANWEQQFAIQPVFPGRGNSNEHKAAKAAWMAANASKIPLDQTQYGEVLGLRDAVSKHAFSSELLRRLPGQNEVSVVVDDPATGVRLKGRFDRLIQWEGLTTIVDAKSCQDASPHGFRSQSTNAKFLWYWQAAFYLELLYLLDPKRLKLWRHTDANGNSLANTAFLFVAVQKGRQVAAVYRPGDDLLDLGRAKWKDALAMHVRGLTTGEWPGYPNEPIPMPAPKWMQYE